MSITLDTTSSNTGGDGLLSSHTVATGVTLLVVGISLRDRVTTIDSVKWGGSGGTLLTRAAQQVHSAGTCTSEVWYLVSPTSGTNDIYVDLSANDNIRVTGSSWFGTAIASVQDGSGAGSQGTSQNVSDNITVVADSLIVDSWIHEDSTASTKGSPQTYLNTGTWDDGTWNNGASYRLATSAGSYAMAWDAAASNVYAHSVAAFKIAASTDIGSKFILGNCINIYGSRV